jgi:arginase
MAPRKIKVIGVPLDLGSDRRGVDMGPSALRVAGLNACLRSLGYNVTDAGNLPTAIAEMHPEGPGKTKYIRQVAKTCRQHADFVEKALGEGWIPLVMGGDHSVAVGTVAGVASFHRKQGKKIGLIWLDAHADMNTPDTTPSGNVHGMPLAACIGMGSPDLTDIGGFKPKVCPENAALIAVRDIDPLEKANVLKSGLRAFTMRDIDERGMRAIMEEAIRAACNGTTGFCATVDMDFLDPEEAPGVGTPVEGGVTYREAHLAMEMVADCGAMLSFEVVEVNPVIDEHNRTAVLATELAMSAFGKKIL